MLTLLLALAIFTHSPLFMLIGLALLAVVGWQILKLIRFVFVLIIAVLFVAGEISMSLTSRQWIGGSVLFVVLSVCSVIVAPTIALPTIFIALLAFGLLVPFLASYSDAKGKTKRQTLMTQSSTGPKSSQATAEAPMLVLE